MHFDRRQALRVMLSGAAALSAPALWGAPEVRPARGLKIKRIDRTTVKLPFRPTPKRNMDREIPHWRWVEVVEVTLQSGHVGFGETLLYYTWGATRDLDVKRALNRNAASLMWDDSLGAGLQVALFDAVAKAMEVPVHSLLGKQVHERTPLAWWNIDTSVEDMVSECKQAHKEGYLAYKTKGRPWFDVWAQAEAVSKELPKNFKLAIDFNDTLLTAEKGMPILKDLKKYPQVAIFETPIFQSDIKGNQAIRRETKIPVAMHYGNPPPTDVIKHEVCDGFVIGGGANRVMARGAVAGAAKLPFWLQLVGSGITAAFSLHLGAVLSHATWPAVNCHQLYTHNLLTKPIEVKEGFAQVPKSPGLGYELDRETMEELKVEKPKSRPEPKRLIETTWPDGRRMYVANNGRVNFMLNLARQGGMPYFERGVDTKPVPDDGSARWRELYAEAREKPVMKRC